MKLSRILASLLCTSMLLSLTACGQDSAAPDSGETQPADTTTAAPETTLAEETTTDRAGAKDSLPADLRFDGQVCNVLTMPELAKFDAYGQREESGDIIFDAVWKRNLAVEERLGITLNIEDSPATKWKDYAQAMRQLVQSGDTFYSFYYTMGNASIQSGNDDLFMDLRDNEYLDFEQPWWWKDAMYSISLDSHSLRYLIGDISLSHRLMVPCTYFNKALYENALGDPDELYKLALDGKWTFDKLAEYSQIVYQDTNGDGAVNEGDLYGSIIGGNETLKKLEHTSDIRKYSRDEEGYIVFDYDTERAQTSLDTLYSLLFETKGIEHRSSNTSAQLFESRQMVFYIEAVWETVNARLRNMEDDFGIIPIPKLDEEQEYQTLIHNNSQFIAVPLTCPDDAFAGAVIEALCAESYRRVIDPFYETALKLKLTRDPTPPSAWI